MLSHDEIRRTLIDYFVERGHRHVPSASLVPRDDPSLLFTTAGMVQFKSLYSTTGALPYRRAVTVQKCLRAGGKDSDLESVGRSPRHLTFFEMLGHFSFGDYFKAEAIEWAWDFFTRVLQVDTERLWVSVFEDDVEAEALWKKVGFPAGRIVRLGADDNFWGPAGDTGACGPNSEIYWDLGPEAAEGEVGGGPGKDDRYVEVWNAVFPQFDQQPDGSRPPLPNRGIDMGAGLERMAVMIQGVENVFQTDLFAPLMAGVREATGYGGPAEGDALVALRRAADHARALAFTLAEGLVPSNVGRGYVLRRILRRAMMALRTLSPGGLREPALYRVVGQVCAHMGAAYPELTEKAEHAALVVRSEEERFLRTLDQGIARYHEVVAEAKAAVAAGHDGAAPAVVLPGDEVFRLYSTYGIPMELTREMAEEQGLGVDEDGYRAALEADRRLSQAAASFNGEADPGTAEGRFEALVDAPPESAFTGYDVTGGTAGEATADATATEWRVREDGDLEVVLDETPFYPTSGGQVADTGLLEAGDLVLAVKDVQKRGSRIVHRVSPPAGETAASVGERLAAGPVRARVDADRRRAVARAHTATHLLHAALHEAIGKEATQAGSWVGPDRLRFDFNHFRALERGELAAVERRVTEWILADIAVADEELPLDEAMARGAMALFGEKYGERVRVISMGGVSLELCGGTHLDSSGGVGPFAILAESSVASGVRRIEAVTGLEAQRLAAERAESLAALVKQLRVPESELAEKVAELIAERQRLRKDLEDLRASQAASRSSELLRPAGVHGGVELLRGELEAESPKEVRGMADSLRGRLEGRVGALLARAGGKLSFLVLVPDALAERLPAGRLVGEAAKAVGGRGGGSATLAQAGLGDADQFETVLEVLGRLLAEAGGES